MPSERSILWFRDIVDNIDRIQGYIHGMTEQEFLADHKTIDAVDRCLARISEAAVRLGKEAEELCGQIPWHDIRGIGNRLRHSYETIVPARIWFTVQRDLDPLRRACESVIANAPDANQS